MRIACLIESLAPGGAERQLVGLASLLKNAQYDVSVITYFPNDFYKYILDESNVPYCCVKHAHNKFFRAFALWRHIKRQHPDTMIAYMPAACMMACFLKMLGLKYTLIVSERNTDQKYGLFEKIKFRLFKYADWVVPNSHMQESVIRLHAPWLMPKVKVITNFVDTNYFVPNKRDDSEVCRIVCVGRVHPQKNVLKYLEVVKALKERGSNFRIDWFGRLDSDYANRCQEKLQELQLEDVFSFKGAVKEIREEYWKADVFCLPSIYEGFPNVVCEAMSCGLPILCSRVCDNPDIVTEGVNGFLFDPANIEDMVHTIEKFIALPKEQKMQMGVTSRQNSLKKFSEACFIEQYDNLLKNI